MAKTPDDDTKRPKSMAKEAALWVLMVMLVVGLGLGYGITGFSGGVAKVGKVGQVEISVDDYARAFRSQVSSFSQQVGQQLSTQEALAFGLDRQVIQSLIVRAALDNEASRVGLSVGDAVVADELKKIDAFKGISGTFDREAYRFALNRDNQTEAGFESRLRADVSRELMQGVITGGFVAPTTLTDTLYAWAAEKRGFSMLRLAEADLTTPLADPTVDEISAYYTANIAAFTKPEAKRITYAALLPEAIAKDQPVDDAVLRKLYDDRIDEFVVPERRLVERLVYPDQAAADAAIAKADAGTPFETLVADRGLTLEAIDLGDVTKDDLGDAGDAVFALPEGGISRPLKTDLGPAIFRVSTILAAEETSFDDARDSLALELQTEAARKVIGDKVEAVDDLLAGGGSLEDLVTGAGMKLDTIDHVKGQQGDAVIEGYPAFRAAADAVADGDFPQAIVLEDGGLVALRFDETVPSAPIPLADVRDKVIAAWRAEALAKALSARADEIVTAIKGGAAIGSFGIVDTTPEIARDGTLDGTPSSLLKQVFAMPDGAVQVATGDGFTAVVQLNRILPAATTGPDAEGMRSALETQAAKAIANDAFASFTDALSAEAGISIDQTTIDRILAGQP
jgi:peptidyl-prolyl cis-trans isomerase D